MTVSAVLTPFIPNAEEGNVLCSISKDDLLENDPLDFPAKIGSDR